MAPTLDTLGTSPGLRESPVREETITAQAGNCHLRTHSMVQIREKGTPCALGLAEALSPSCVPAKEAKNAV